MTSGDGSRAPVPYGARRLQASIRGNLSEDDSGAKCEGKQLGAKLNRIFLSMINR
jgi:hypothetical protein